MHRMLSAAASVLVVIASLIGASGAAYAHTTRNIGPYEVKIGWVSEPAYAGLLNAVELGVTDTRTNAPVTGLEKTLTVEIAAGGLAPVKLEIAPAEDEPGAYRAAVIPTATGAYTFHITGKIDTQSVDEKVESGPNTFDDVTSAQAAQYPTKVPQADDLARQLDDLRSSADEARLLALGALVLALIGLGAALVMARRRA
ncbi:MAG TPA: FixH family protein [Candidatus Limnocylindria bacterium]